MLIQFLHEVKNKLVEFVNSSNYLEYLTSHVKQ